MDGGPWDGTAGECFAIMTFEVHTRFRRRSSARLRCGERWLEAQSGSAVIAAVVEGGEEP